MPLSHEEFRALRDQGLSIPDILAHERSDTTAAPVSMMSTAPQDEGGGNPLAGLAGAGADALGGLRGLGVLGGLGGGAYLLRRFMANRAAQPASTAAAPQVPMAQAPTLPQEPAIAGAPAPGARSGAPTTGLPSSLVELTQEDIDSLPQLSNRKPGHVIRRASLERMYESAAEVKQSPRIGKSPTELAVEYRKSEPTRPITMEGQPAKAPAPTPEGPGVGRGKSAPRIARETKFRAERGMATPEGEVRTAIRKMPSDIERLTARRALSTLASAEASAAEKAAAESVVRSVMGKFGTGAVAALPFILDLVRGTNPMEEAAPLLEYIHRQGLSPERRALEDFLKQTTAPQSI